MNIRSIIFTVFASTILLALPALSASLGPISEETQPAICNPGSLVTEVKCTGKYCDNLKIKCGGPAGEFHARRATNAVWTSLKSEESGGMNVCPTDHYIAGFACNGRYCDNLSLYCVKLRGVTRTSFPCADKGPISEENGGRLKFTEETLGLKFGAISMHCTGRYCDNKKFKVCPLRAD